MKRFIFLLAAAGVTLLAAACITVRPAFSALQNGTPTVAAAFTPTLVCTDTPPRLPTATPLPPAASATPQSVQGTLTIKVNVRSGPGTAYASLGQLQAGQQVQITVRDATGTWYKILYPGAPGGTGWVTTQYVTLAAGAQVPLDVTPTSTTPAVPQGRVLQLLNVRSGPGTSFDSLGQIQPNATVALTGKDATAAWFQINYPTGPGGHAWVTAQYVQTNASDQLPVLDAYGTPVPANGTTGAVSSSQQAATPTLGPAFADNDSAASPSVNVTFSATGTHQFTYSGQVSAPQGDPQDWVEFDPFAINSKNASLVFSLSCTGNGTLTVAMERAGKTLTGWGALACGDQNKAILLPAGQPIEMQLAPSPGQGLQLVNYVLTLQNEP
jgi:uncharacterized protein YraI